MITNVQEVLNIPLVHPEDLRIRDVNEHLLVD